MPARRPSARRTPRWDRLTDEALLDVRICDLGLQLAGTPLERAMERLDAELERRKIHRFRPYAWLSTDWFTPDGMTGFAIPFYLAHPRLQRLEQKMMLEVEGGSREWCMKIMRHEAAHAIDNAYRLHWKKRWREVFGKFSQKYDTAYSPDPNSRQHVQNLPYWYAQSHPAEDWAETFAVWLQPGGRWRQRYAKWPALRKLEFVDELMAEIADTRPVLKTRSKDEPVREVKMTLREYYERKQAIYEDDTVPTFDGQLVRLFEVAEPGRNGVPTALAFLRRHRRRLVRHVSSVTGQHAYVVDHVVGEMARRGKKLKLQLRASEQDTLIEASVLVTALTMQFLHGSHPRYQR